MTNNTSDAQKILSPKSTKEGDLEQYFEFFFGAHRPPVMHAERGWHPPADLFETEKEIHIRVDIAGIALEDINLLLDRELLILSGIRKEATISEKRQYHKMEVAYGPFERIFNLPSPVCADQVKAVYKDGFLTIELLKREKPIAKKRIIKIQ
jgi:HSP20 family protein